LRKALSEEIRAAIETGRVERHLKNHSIDIVGVVKAYLPEGISFDHAEDILRSAGFDIEARPTADSPGRFAGGEFAFDVNAWLGSPANRFEGPPCIVALRPARPYDYSQVYRVFAQCSWVGL